MRVTSQIERIEAGQIQTRSGSTYTLEGPPATRQQLADQRTRQEALLCGREAIDVTELYATEYPTNEDRLSKGSESDGSTNPLC